MHVSSFRIAKKGNPSIDAGLGEVVAYTGNMLSKPLFDRPIASENGFGCNCLLIQKLRAMKQVAATPVKIEGVIEA